VRNNNEDSRRMLLKRTLTHILLTLALLVGQQAAFAHAATHLAGKLPTQDKQLPHSKACGECVQGAQLGAALLDTAPPSPGIPVSSIDLMADCRSVHIPSPLRAFSSRAPPTLL
jgi:hypothetical protein